MPPKPDPHLFTYLTQAEWKLCFAVAFPAHTDLFEGSYPLEMFATPGADGDTWEEYFRRAIRYLAMEHHVGFEGIHVNREGILVEHTVMEPGNALYVTAAKAGRLPGSPKAALEFTLQYAPQAVPSLDLDPLRGCLATINEHLAAQQAALDPQRMRREYERNKEALKEIGVAPIRGVVH